MSKHQPFEALVLNPHTPDQVKTIFPANFNGSVVMEVIDGQEAVYITKEHCMEFFGLIDLPIHEVIQ